MNCFRDEPAPGAAAAALCHGVRGLLRSADLVMDAGAAKDRPGSAWHAARRSGWPCCIREAWHNGFSLDFPVSCVYFYHIFMIIFSYCPANGQGKEMMIRKIHFSWCKDASIVAYHVIALAALIYSAFILTSIVTKDKQVDLTQKIRLDKIEVYREASNLVTKRLYDQQRLVWKIKDAVISNENTVKRHELDEMFNYYMESVREYNIHSRMLIHQLKYVFNEGVSELFSSDRENDTSSITFSFMQIHNKILKLRENSWNNLEKKLVMEVENDSYKLFSKVDNYLKKMAEITFSKDKDLEKHTI